MSTATVLETHLFLQRLPRRIEEVDGIVFLLHCSACGRDYVQHDRTTRWYAAYVGVFLVQPLLENVTERWIAEPCPGRRLQSDENDRAQHRD